MVERDKELDKKNRSYYNQKGYNGYTVTFAETDELDRNGAARALASNLKKAEERANIEGWIDADDFDRKMGIID